MNIQLSSVRGRDQGHALVVVLAFLVVGLITLAGSMGWLATNARLIERNNQYFTALAAAEAATEKAIAAMAFDYQRFGASHLASRLPDYAEKVPTTGEYAGWAAYRFYDRDANEGRMTVEQTAPWEVTGLISQYTGLSGYAASYRVLAAAGEFGTRHEVMAAVEQEFQIATIPLFQFAIFYNIDLEINPGPAMFVNGRVHSNQDLYTRPHNTLTFGGNVTAAGQIFHHRKPNDGLTPGSGTVVYSGAHDSGVNTLNLPLGVENTPENIRQIVAMPPTDESPTSDLGRQRYFNKSDLVIQVRDHTVEVSGGAHQASGVTLSYGDVSSFLNTNVTFFNRREGKTIRATEIDVGNFKTWAESSNPLSTHLGREVNSVYVVDLRTQTVDTQPGIRLVNGQELPARGLTVASAQPIYVQGHYNAPAGALGTADTSNTKPAALIGDAVTVLSGNWTDSASTAGLSSRVASPTTVNAAILAGIVPTTYGSYSGGVENFPRFLENWSGRTLTYNGSMIVLFPSEVAVGAWRGTGGTHGIYNPPVRNWAFDLSFLDPNRLPPGTPEVRAVVRGAWRMASAPKPG